MKIHKKFSSTSVREYLRGHPITTIKHSKKDADYLRLSSFCSFGSVCFILVAGHWSTFVFFPELQKHKLYFGSIQRRPRRRRRRKITQPSFMFGVECSFSFSGCWPFEDNGQIFGIIFSRKHHSRH